MALAWNNVSKIYRGPITLVYGEATFDSSYAAGGEAIVPADVGLTTIKALFPTATSGFNVTYARTSDVAGKIAIYASLTPDTNSAVSAPLDSSVARDYSTTVITCLILGNG
jgi:hypothetical protein